jgi:hypothetical protein
MEFLDIDLIEDSSLFLHAIHSRSAVGFLKKTRLCSVSEGEKIRGLLAPEPSIWERKAAKQLHCTVNIYHLIPIAHCLVSIRSCWHFLHPAALN